MKPIIAANVASPSAIIPNASTRDLPLVPERECTSRASAGAVSGALAER
jgi:hypothetical protein